MENLTVAENPISKFLKEVMKKPVAITLAIFSTFWIGFRFYSYLNSISIFNNQVVFEIYLDLNENEIDDFFSVKPGTYNKKKHLIICKLPVNIPGFSKQINEVVEFGTEKIDCNETYNEQQHTKYHNAELNNSNYGILMIVDNRALVKIIDYNLPIGGKVYGSKAIKLDYVKGKINRIVVSKDSIYEYCK